MEKTELLQVVKLLDKIIGSNSLNVKDAFRELLIIAALTEAPDDGTPGPLASFIFSEIDTLRKEIQIIHRELSQRSASLRSGRSYYDEYNRTSVAASRDPYYTSMANIEYDKIAWSGITKTPKNII